MFGIFSQYFYAQMQRRITFNITGVWVCSQVEQRLNILEMQRNRRKVQSRGAFFVRVMNSDAMPLVEKDN